MTVKFWSGQAKQKHEAAIYWVRKTVGGGGADIFLHRRTFGTVKCSLQKFHHQKLCPQVLNSELKRTASLAARMPPEDLNSSRWTDHSWCDLDAAGCPTSAAPGGSGQNWTPPRPLCFIAHSVITLWPAAPLSKTSSTCHSQAFALRCTWCCEDGTSYPSFLPLFLKPARKRNGGELSQSQQRSSKGALWQLSAHGREFSPPQPPKSGHLPGNEIFSSPRCWPVARDIQVGSREGNSCFFMKPRMLGRTPKDANTQVIGISQILLEISKQQSNDRKGKFPFWLTVLWKYSKAHRSTVVWPLPLLQFSLSDGDEIEEKGTFCF